MHKLHLACNDATYSVILKIKAKTNKLTTAEVIADALRVYDFILQQKEVRVVKEDGTLRIIELNL